MLINYTIEILKYRLINIKLRKEHLKKWADPSPPY